MKPVVRLRRRLTYGSVHKDHVTSVRCVRLQQPLLYLRCKTRTKKAFPAGHPYLNGHFDDILHQVSSMNCVFPTLEGKHIRNRVADRYRTDVVHYTNLSSISWKDCTFCFRFLQDSHAIATRFRLAGSTRLLRRRSADFSSVDNGRLLLLESAGDDMTGRRRLVSADGYPCRWCRLRVGNRRPPNRVFESVDRGR
jgi:hypothetical protein